MTSCLDEARRDGMTSDYVHGILDNDVHRLVGYLGGCERIRKTTLPFVLGELMGWYSVVAVLMVAYTVFGIEEIGVEIEGPFEYDENDLPMEEICETIHKNVHALAGMSHPLPEKMPAGL